MKPETERGDALKANDFLERHITVEIGQLKLFAKATGAVDLAYTQDNASSPGGSARYLAPPTYLYSLGLLAFGAETWSGSFGIDPARLLHGEQTFEYFHPIFAGDELLLRRRIVDRYEKKNGQLSFVVVDTEAFNQRDELCVRARMVGVMQNP